ncbi:transporter [Acinetobacter calcoaceticus]|uniref:SphA family protein n=1 Tax=Acinetobacter calcoaceticus TaxID=471 RepID=UPI00192BC042|nr:transporter [Acinetobacter calcoaceticus]
MEIKKNFLSYLVFFLTCLFQYKTQAAETIALAGPIGGTDIGSAFLPPSGNYIAGIGAAIKNQKWYDNDGKQSDVKGAVYIGGVGLLHVYKTQLYGGSLASSVFLGYQELCFGFDTKECVSGFRDVYSDLITWSKFYPTKEKDPSHIPYGLAITTGLGVNFPLGAYKEGNSLNVGSNFYTISPNIGITYTFESFLPSVFGEATELSSRLAYNYYTKNEATDYVTGPVLNMDYAITQRKEKWQYGITGTTYKQLRDDKVQGHYIKDTEAKTLTMGPLVAYNLKVDKKTYNVMLKLPMNVWGENNLECIGATLRVSTSF